jgi:D-arabinose 5-phosphate isomerase GutQ
MAGGGLMLDNGQIANGGLMSDAAMSRAADAFRIESEAVASAFGHIDKAMFGKAVGLLCRAPRTAASGCGHSGIACMHFAHLMCCIERPARFIPPSEALHGAMGFVQKGDAVLLASRGGKTPELLPIMGICKKKGAAVICVTENMESPLAQGADATLRMLVEREADRDNAQGTASFAAMNAIFDALQSAIIEETDYQIGAFAVIHPGGAVGERLNSV